jgi:hypothetical protein
MKMLFPLLIMGMLISFKSASASPTKVKIASSADESHRAFMFVGSEFNHELGLIACADTTLHQYIDPSTCQLPQTLQVAVGIEKLKAKATKVHNPPTNDSNSSQGKTAGIVVAKKTNASTVAIFPWTGNQQIQPTYRDEYSTLFARRLSPAKGVHRRYGVFC